jgi:hypothetical protein
LENRAMNSSLVSKLRASSRTAGGEAALRGEGRERRGGTGTPAALFRLATQPGGRSSKGQANARLLFQRFSSPR